MTLHTEESKLALVTALRAALDAGDYLKSRYQTELVVKQKTSLSDVVTDVDPHCEKLIRERVASAFPNHAFLGEEAVGPGKEASVTATEHILHADDVWIVDPLDGTTNYVHGIPLSVVSIAYASRGQLQVGVIYDPYRNEVFFAERGRGAFTATDDAILEWLKDSSKVVPGTPMRASTVTELEHAVVATGLPIRHEERDELMVRTMNLIGCFKSLRNLGAAALHLAYVGAGRVDGFWEYELNAWDIAAGVLILTEAGGFAGTLDGQKYTLSTRNIVASGQEELAKSICGMMSKG